MTDQPISCIDPAFRRARSGRSRSRLGSMVALVVAASALFSAAPAHAAIIDIDAVNTLYAGSGLTGNVYWRNVNDGFAQLTVHNPPDGFCVVVDDRVKRNGVWGPWRHSGSFCYDATYPLNLPSYNTGQRIDSWQFRSRPAWRTEWTPDTNAPGGA